MSTILITTLVSFFLVPCGFMGVLYLEEEEIINKLTKYLLILLVCLLPTIISFCTLGNTSDFKTIAAANLLMIQLGLLGVGICFIVKSH